MDSTRTTPVSLRCIALAVIVTIYAPPPTVAGEIPPQLAAFDPFVDRTWKAPGRAPKEPGDALYDIARWDRALKGQAVRIVHSVGDGAYGGETLVVWDRERGGA